MNLAAPRPPSMRGAFARDAMIYGGATLLTGLSNVALVAIYTRSIERSAYGAVDFVGVLQLLIQVVVGLELTQAIARFYGGADSDDERRVYASTGFWSLVVVYAFVCAALFIGSDWIEHLLFDDVSPGILRPAILSIYLGVMYYVARSQLRWELRATQYLLASAASVAITLTLSAFLLVVAHAGILGVFVGLSIGSASGLAVSLWALRGTYIFVFELPALKRMLGFSIPLTVSTLALLAASYGDRLVIRAVMGFGDLGGYAAGAKIASVIALASAGFQLGAAPLIYRHHRSPETREALAQLLRLFVGIGSVGVLALAAVAIELLTLFAGPSYADAWGVVPVLSLATVLGSGYVFLPGLSIEGRTRQFAAISITTAVVSLASIVPLALAFGIVGASFGVLIGGATGFALHAAASQRVYALPVLWWRVAAAIAIVGAAFASSATLGTPGSPTLLGRIAVDAIAALAVVVVLLTPADRALAARLLSLRWLVRSR